MNDESWRLNTDDEITVELSSGSVVIDHEQREGSTGLANLNLVGRDVTATLHGLTPTDLRALARACESFAGRLDDLQRECDMDMAAAEPSGSDMGMTFHAPPINSSLPRAAAAEPSEPQESRQESGTGTDAQQEATGFATHLSEQSRRALPSEVAEAMYWDADATHLHIAAVIMDRLEAAGMRIVKETTK